MGRSIIFNIRDGVQFHHGWGELTAEDVAWSFNDALREGNTNGTLGFRWRIPRLMGSC